MASLLHKKYISKRSIIYVSKNDFEQVENFLKEINQKIKKLLHLLVEILLMKKQQLFMEKKKKRQFKKHG